MNDDNDNVNVNLNDIIAITKDQLLHFLKIRLLR